jgi:hypothetical protein
LGHDESSLSIDGWSAPFERCSRNTFKKIGAQGTIICPEDLEDLEYGEPWDLKRLAPCRGEGGEG